MTISIIIPVLNEAEIILKTIKRLQGNSDVEIIVVDGGSEDTTVEIVQQSGVQLVISQKAGRSNQMNHGTAIAKGDILLFLHADTQLPVNYAQLIQKTIVQPHVIAGAFELAIDSTQTSLRFIEIMVNLRSRFLSLPYGDQALFLKQKTFAAIGGFPNLPIMEDFEFVKKLKKHGNIALVPAKVITSSRRWQKLGVFKTTVINQLIILGYYLGVSPIKLQNFYRQAKR